MACAGTEGVKPAELTLDPGDRPAIVERAPEEIPTSKLASPPPIAWLIDERIARETARRTARPMFVFARADWSAASLTMDRVVWPDLGVRAAAQPFVALRVDLTADDPDANARLDHLAIVGLPSLIVFDEEGVEVARVERFADAVEVASVLREARAP